MLRPTGVQLVDRTDADTILVEESNAKQQALDAINKLFKNELGSSNSVSQLDIEVNQHVADVGVEECVHVSQFVCSCVTVHRGFDKRS